jgi:hypothetical protein
MKRISMLIIAAAGGLAYLYFARTGKNLRRLGRPRPQTDEALAKAVERRLRRILDDPRTVQVSLHEGAVTLRGSVEREQLDRCLRAALSVPGVTVVVNRLEAEGPPALPGAGIAEIGL